jgi:hypothetical protein
MRRIPTPRSTNQRLVNRFQVAAGEHDAESAIDVPPIVGARRTFGNDDRGPFPPLRMRKRLEGDARRLARAESATPTPIA